jgi:hypothetical protein
MSPGSTFTASVNVPVTGTYDLSSADIRAPDVGIYALSVDGQTVGSPTDTYSGFGGYPSVATDHGTIALTAGTHQLTVTVLDKNPTSSGYSLAPDYFEFALQST